MSVAPTSLYMLRAEHFSDKIGHRFDLETPAGTAPLVLAKVDAGTEPIFSGTDRVPFTLVFIGPHAEPGTGHCMMNLRHRTLGLIEGIFIGPNLGTMETEWGKGQIWSATFT
ncbi:hypothetical protein NUH88_16000 [Nisaea acidiphila]|uniref:DUF6916 domain-containing protein n=1 Tax=Nisaea acidiphila TaxID=1862145 RepID=A0A9J7APQ1_9PROT|nr:hypothetical protein [Nisaea acidiphila]UUX48890.1 hypothetical protein NUH88_15980 [Nisaea acidiphila]UUX48894.1 hypothetical protein NUH88_16000 [Nisaea acidiphila]